MKAARLMMLLLLLPDGGRAQQYHLRDGHVLDAIDVAVRGVSLVEAVDAVSADAVVERNYPISDVVRLDWPEPDAFEAARSALARGAGREAVVMLEPVRAEFVLFAKLPGSWWTAASLLRLRGLMLAGAADEAEAAARELIATAIDPEAVGLARLGLAELQLAAGQGEIAAAMVEAILKEDVPAGVRARSWLLRGERALQQGDAEAALEAFLRIPVLHASREGLLAPALEGSRRAYLLWDDPARADRAAEELRRTFPDSPEAARLAARPNDLPSPL
jgi:tetratricopeptide (TPR) repeat protein